MKRNKILFIIGLLFLLILVLGAAYAYFQININNNTTNSSVMGTTNKYGTATFTTNTSKLYLKLTNDEMSEDNQGTTYYANSDTSGTPLTTNPNYILATASLADGDLPLDCTYNFKVTASVTKSITDGSDEDVKITIGNTTKTLKELTAAGTNGLVITGTIKNLVTGENQSLNLSSTLVNTTSNQSGLSGNSYTITISPYTGGDIKAFSCKLAFQFDSKKSLAQNLIDSEWLWQSNLEGDGYRYVGTGLTCSYDNGNYIEAAANQSTSPSCPSLYNYTRTKISDGSTTNYTYLPSCPNNNSTYTYSCTELTGVLTDDNNVPNNFICFGTTSKSDCTSNQDKYMYRIIGVFPDENGNQHVKLIKYKQLGSYKWNDTNADVNWEESTLYKGLNGEYFLTNSDYDYLQNSAWLNKIANWTWSAVNTKTFDGSNGPNYYAGVSPKEIYLHEMNRSTKTNTIGNWTIPTGKIGLMYVSDYALSLGSSALVLTTDTYTNSTLLKTGWMHQSNNDTAKSPYEWTLSRIGGAVLFSAWYVYGVGDVNDNYTVDVSNGSRPVLYLNSTEKLNLGTGSLEDPYILEQ